MKVFLTGANGFIGRHILKACLAQGHQVTASVRSAEQLRHYFPTARFTEGNFATDHEPGHWLPRLQGMDIVINAVGIIHQRGANTFDAIHRKAACALFQACEQSKVKQVIQISALGTDDSAFSEYHLSKKAADDFLTRLNLNWVIMKPSIVYGPGAKSMELFTAMAALPWTPLIGKGNQAIQPVHIDDLVRALLITITDESIHHRYIDVVGPKAMSMKTVFSLLKAWLAMRSKRFILVPNSLMLVLAQLSGILSTSPINTDTVKMLNNGNTANVQPFITLFGFSPVAFKQSLLQQPPLISDVIYARHYFLWPLFRIALALLWIMTGIISAFIYPLADSYALLAQAGIPDNLAPLVLYSAAVLDVALGVALLVGWKVKPVAMLQIAIIVFYSLVITLSLPAQWVHPFGPITKNIPLVVATLLLLAREK